MSLPHITDDELVMYHLDDLRNVAVQDYMRRNLLDVKDVDLYILHEMFQWEWQQRLYADELE